MKKLNLNGVGQVVSKNQMKKVTGGYVPGACLYCNTDHGTECFPFNYQGMYNGEACSDYTGYPFYENPGGYWDTCYARCY